MRVRTMVIALIAGAAAISAQDAERVLEEAERLECDGWSGFVAGDDPSRVPCGKCGRAHEEIGA